MGKDKELKKYFKEITAYSRFTPKDTRKLVKELKISVTDYISANPHYQMEDIVSAFGTPEEIALSFLSVANLKYLNRKLRINGWTIFTLTVIILAYLTFLFSYYIRVNQAVPTYYTENIVITEVNQ